MTDKAAAGEEQHASWLFDLVAVAGVAHLVHGRGPRGGVFPRWTGWMCFTVYGNVARAPHGRSRRCSRF
ncbi:hypothetical protein [Amycolatopsis sp. FDAARGOS 1241]|uniref:hypothetical protein n=1 Tax=Amycolatopsis sp. FDAARGOS 1241 TaxID=2778070 RepID=UPI00194F6707|nr:hypothetical protein [Amycolatopsis sp. FDAARGOS 1241]QRP43972.1 hypothetical protein I6J71_32280 [Amycolatopsis sp. FDAARGOS 1241]